MGAVRVRWSALARWLAAAALTLLALQALPSLLRPPAPPPLAGRRRPAAGRGAGAGHPARGARPVSIPRGRWAARAACSRPRPGARRAQGEAGRRVPPHRGHGHRTRSRRRRPRNPLSRPRSRPRRRRNPRQSHRRPLRATARSSSLLAEYPAAIVPRRFGSRTRIRACPDARPGQGRACPRRPRR